MALKIYHIREQIAVVLRNKMITLLLFWSNVVKCSHNKQKKCVQGIPICTVAPDKPLRGISLESKEVTLCHFTVPGNDTLHITLQGVTHANTYLHALSCTTAR